MKRGLMKDAIFARCLEFLRANKETVKVIVLYHGGEPLLHADFFDYARAVRGCCENALIKTVTNGMALNGRNQERLVDCGLNEVEVSLDGLSGAENEQVRVGSDTARVIENVKGLLGSRRRRGLAAPAVFVSTTQFVERAAPIPQSAPVPQWLTSAFAREAENGEVAFKATFAMRWPHMVVDRDRYDVITDPNDGDNKGMCDHAMSTTTVRSDGTVVPCCYDLTTQLPMGNVLETPLAEILDGPKYSEFRAAIAAGRYLGICNTCNVVRRNVFLVPRWRRPGASRA